VTPSLEMIQSSWPSVTTARDGSGTYSPKNRRIAPSICVRYSAVRKSSHPRDLGRWASRTHCSACAVPHRRRMVSDGSRESRSSWTKNDRTSGGQTDRRTPSCSVRRTDVRHISVTITTMPEIGRVVSTFDHTRSSEVSAR